MAIDIPALQSKTESASRDLATLQTDVPGMLSSLKSSLTSIFAKDNPLIKARDEALSTFLSQPDVSRAELLPQNMPNVLGSPLTLSPTQQQSIVSSRQSAALAPLLGLNQAVLTGYGNIGDIVRGAGDIYGSQVEAAKTNLASAMQAYNDAVQQDQYNRTLAEQQRQFDKKQKSAATSGIDLAEILKIIYGGQQPGGTPAKPDPAQFDEPDQDIEIPGQGVIQPYTPAPVSSPPGRWNPFAQFGAIGELLFGKRPETTQQPATSLNLLGQQNYGPFRQ